MVRELHIVKATVGVNPGTSWIEGGTTVDIDNDGVFEPRPRAVIDLSEMLSYRLGRQIPQCANYRVSYISIGMRNVNDLQDNDAGAHFSGTMEWYSPTKHRVEGMQAWRKLERHLQKSVTTAEGFFMPDEKYYKGFRVGMTTQVDVSHPTIAGAGLVGALPDGYNLVDCLAFYEKSLTDTNGNGVEYDNALYDRRVGRTTHLDWSTDIMNNMIDTDGVNSHTSFQQINDFQWTAPSGTALSVLNGLLILNFEHCSTDEWVVGTNLDDDDFEIDVTIGIEGWTPW